MAAAGLVALVVLFVCSFLIDFQGDNLTMDLPVAIKFDASAHGVDSSVPNDAQLEKVRGTLKFPIRKGAFLSGSVFVIVLMLGLALWAVTQLREVFRSLTRGRPFVAENSRRIRWVGFAIIIGEFVRAILVFFWCLYTSQHFTINGVRFIASADVNGITIIAGLAILVIAEVFREGTRLQEDQSLTI
jgi:hypothetical protein